MLSLWRTIYAGKGAGRWSGYTLAQMISYYLLVTVVDALTAVNEDDWQIAADIKDGNISQFLLKPIDYLWYRLCLFLSGRVTFMAVAAVPLAVFIPVSRHYFVLPANGRRSCAFLVSMVLTALLQFFMSYAMAMLAFWVLEVSTFIFILFAFEYLASGHLFPLDILPPALEQALFFTPFPYQLYFPVSIYMGKIAGADLCAGPVRCRRAGCWRPMASRGSCGGAASGSTARWGMKHESKVRQAKVESSPDSRTCRAPSTLRPSPVTSAIYAALWKNSVAREMTFKGNFLLWILVELLWFGLQLSFIGVLYLHTDHIGTWTQVAGGAAGRRQPFHPADVPGVFSDQLHQPFRTRPHRQTGFPAAAAGQHALRRLAAAGGPRRVRQRRASRWP